MDAEAIYQEAATAGSMAGAAAAFLRALRPAQRQRAALDFGDEAERKNWHYVPRERQGLPLKDMDPGQRERAFALVSTGLSSQAYDKVRTIISLESVLAHLEGPERRFVRDPELYYVSVFGDPGGEEPWGWRFEGHHVSLNYTLAGGYMVGPAPIFFGANPAHVRHGERQGLRALKEEEDLARQLLAELDGEQKGVAIVSKEAPPDIITRNVPHVRGEVRPEGLQGAAMSRGQRELLRALIKVYVHRLPDEVAEVEWSKLERADLEQVCFAWAGGQERGGPHYYRVQGELFVAEYDNTQNDANHIHAVWRDLSNDFGEDILRRHYREGH